MLPDGYAEASGPLPTEALLCGAALRSIDNGAPCVKYASHVDREILALGYAIHVTDNQFWWREKATTS